MHNTVINKDILEFAKDYNFKITKKFIYGKIGAAITYISTNLQESETYILINTFAMKAEEVESVIQKLEKISSDEKLYFKFKLKFIHIKVNSRIHKGWEKHRDLIRQIFSVLETTSSVGSSEIIEYDGFPVFDAQLEEMSSFDKNYAKSLSDRLKNVGTWVIGLFIVLFLSAKLFPKSIALIGSNLLGVMLAVLVWPLFFNRYHSSESSLKKNVIYCALINIAVILVYGYLTAFLSIPPEYSKSQELINFLFSKWVSTFEFFQIIPVVFFPLVFAYSKVLEHKSEKIQNFTYEEYSELLQLRQKLALIAGGAVVTGIAITLISLFSSNANITSEGVNFIAPALISYFVLFLLLYSGSKLFFKNENLIKSSDCFLFALVAPLTISWGIYHSLSYFNKQLSKEPFITKHGYVSHVSPSFATRALCYYIRDEITKNNLPLYICEREDQFIRPGIKVTYQNKPGFFGGQLYLEKAIHHSNTVEALFEENRGQIEKIRNVDIKFLLQIEKEKKALYEKYESEWQLKCKKGIGSYCRFASYLATAKDEDKKSHLLIDEGCKLNDYTSCCGRCHDETETEMIKKFELLAVKACRNHDYSACSLYSDDWYDDKSMQRRKDFREVLDILCKSGDSRSCTILVWEMHRI